MENDLAIVFSFDNVKQLFITELTIRTIDIPKNAKYIFAINKDIKDNEELINLSNKYNASIIVYPNDSLKGKFYWYSLPFITNFDKYLCIDNDLIFKNLDINFLFDKYAKKMKKKSFLGVQGHVWRVKRKRELIRTFRPNYLNYLFNLGKYINTGVVLVNGNRVRNKYTRKLIEDKIFHYESILNASNSPILDQEFMSIYFNKDLAFISNRFNLRVRNPFWIIVYFKKDNLIYHYNLWRNYRGAYRKFNFQDKIINSNEETLFTELLEFWSVDGKYKISKRFEKGLKQMVKIAFDSKDDKNE